MDDLDALTPNHLIVGRGSLNLPLGIFVTFVDKEISIKQRRLQAQVVATHIWNRRLREYLPGLITHRKWSLPTANVNIGDLVLVIDHTASRGPQPLGRNVRVFPGHDNVLRSAEVKTKLGVLKHPVTNLPLLEEWSPI